ncbi:MAG: DUF6134 family protein [Chitinophagaceae bacterium]
MVIKFSFVLLLLTGALGAVAQKIKMEVMMGEKKIGEINAEKVTKDKAAEYSMKSDVKTTMVFTVMVNIVTKTYWYDGNLTVSRAIRTSNMPGQDENTGLEIKGKQYQLTKNGKISQMDYPINLCVTNLYFQEPIKDTAAFSEIQGMYLTITNLGNHQYQVKQPNGKKNIYFYVNGKLQKIETVVAGNNVVFLVK